MRRRLVISEHGDRAPSYLILPRRGGGIGGLRFANPPYRCIGSCTRRTLRLVCRNMATYNLEMDISVTDFKHRCLEIIRRVEKTGKPVSITRRGKVVVRLQPSSGAARGHGLKPWERVRALGGRLLAKPGESVLRDEDFEALR